MVIKFPYCKPEVWGGIECTINRVGNDYRDQLSESGHYTRAGDIDHIASLGIRKIRYPILWEKHKPIEDHSIDWQWIEQQLECIRKHNVIPIAGLVHHGSGPGYTNLLDKEFPIKLACYAFEVASKFPWLEYYTPVNEPLTTARFSGLYGLWYPHHTDEKSFVKILLNQVKAIVLSMQAIRSVNPGAKLIQTEDLSKTHSTPLLTYQADFENKRRWLTYDLLCGKVNRKHFFWNYFISLGIDESELQFFLDNKCPPDIIGFNYYVTSERYLDEEIGKYPECTHGGNLKHKYADTEAVRSVHPLRLDKLLTEAWNRYKLPIAITECHLNCTREEQLRWFKETWDTIVRLNEEGINIQAITAWALLGAFDWSSLLTLANQDYEPGVFDIRNGDLRPTALTKLIRGLATKNNYGHPVLSEPGWWHRKKRSAIINVHAKEKSPVLITGCNGTLGHAFVKICERRNIPYIALSRHELDISNEPGIIEAIEQHKPWAIINAAGYVRVDDAEIQKEECFSINATGPALLAKSCRKKDIRLMTFSSDLVFDGTKKTPYDEADPINPLNIYGMSKARGEEEVMAADKSALIIRTSAFFGPWDRYNFVYNIIQSLQNNESINVADDVMISPTYVPDLIDTSLDLLIDEEQGIWHIANEGMTTWNDFACTVAERAGYTKRKIMARSLTEMGLKAQRPLYSVLQSKKGVKLPRFENALARYFEQHI